MDDKTKCFSVNLTADQAEKLRILKEKTGKSQGQILSESVETGLKNALFFIQAKKFYLVKVRINTDLLAELSQKLQNNDLDRSMYLFTYCLKDDPTVGVSLWTADDRKHFDKIFAPHKAYYKNVIEIDEVVTPEESMQLIIAGLRK